MNMFAFLSLSLSLSLTLGLGLLLGFGHFSCLSVRWLSLTHALIYFEVLEALDDRLCVIFESAVFLLFHALLFPG